MSRPLSGSARRAGRGRRCVLRSGARAGRDRRRAGRAPGPERASGEGRDRSSGADGAQDRGVCPSLRARRPVARVRRRKGRSV